MSKKKKGEEEEEKKHDFWYTQPVAHSEKDMAKSFEEIREIQTEDVKAIAKATRQPFRLPEGLEWNELDDAIPAQLDELYILLAENYVEDQSSWFAFNYDRKTIRWAIAPPGTGKDWKLGIRSKLDNQLLGFISATPTDVQVRGNVKRLVIIDFLCVHRTIRQHRLAPVMISEICRRVNVRGIFQAVYTAGAQLPTPWTTARYFHRSINVSKLIDVKFTHMPRNMTMAATNKLYRVEETAQIKGWRPFKAQDAAQVLQKMNRFLTEYFPISTVFHSQAEIIHLFTNRPGIVYSFVVEDRDHPIIESAEEGEKKEEVKAEKEKETPISQTSQTVKQSEQQQIEGETGGKKGKKRRRRKKKKSDQQKEEGEEDDADDKEDEDVNEKEKEKETPQETTKQPTHIDPTSDKKGKKQNLIYPITDFISFYIVNSACSGHPKYKSISVGYLFYYFYTPRYSSSSQVPSSTSTSIIPYSSSSYSIIPPTFPPGSGILIDLVRDILVEAKKADVDVFNVLDVMHNKMLFDELKFSPGDGKLNYYFYNLVTPKVQPEQSAIILV
ncbi:MAG: putative Glycylpeptide N-tetradecanoyltransferase [Streblomastix strix]|uniref:Glycylpeptide N-tetradecanoyltransferase n=1 Tax=Streblomastix strix TaxID=222440 RepID=A0A5J4WMT6_9EUKA|nr:MAG: putative Glycylpeptide N-tetradecanoyltransferase [Streblomastix strix]